MGLEYQIDIPNEFNPRLEEDFRLMPEFIFEERGSFYFGTEPTHILFMIKIEQDHLYVCQHFVSRETNAMLGLIIKLILSLYDKIVISEI